MGDADDQNVKRWELSQIMKAIESLSEKIDKFQEEKLEEAIAKTEMLKDIEFLKKENDRQNVELENERKSRAEEVKSLRTTQAWIIRLVLPILGVGLALSWLAQAGLIPKILT